MGMEDPCATPQTERNFKMVVVGDQAGKTQTQTFGSGYLPVGWGVSHKTGWGDNKFGTSPKPSKAKLFVSRDFCQDIPGCPKSFPEGPS